jgi:hypothetical protein
VEIWFLEAQHYRKPSRGVRLERCQGYTGGSIYRCILSLASDLYLHAPPSLHPSLFLVIVSQDTQRSHYEVLHNTRHSGLVARNRKCSRWCRPIQGWKHNVRRVNDSSISTKEIELTVTKMVTVQFTWITEEHRAPIQQLRPTRYQGPLRE